MSTNSPGPGAKEFKWRGGAGYGKKAGARTTAVLKANKRKEAKRLARVRKRQSGG